MDTSDPEISFDASGTCNHCKRYDWLIRSINAYRPEGPARLSELVADVQAAGRGREYDCVIGVSGGVDSTYVAYLTKQLGLRPLAIHLDNGWNSTTAVENIVGVLDRLGIDLYTEVLEWDEFKDLQLAFLRASTPDSEVPTDHAIYAVLMQAARRHNIKHVITGANAISEGVLPRSWTRGTRDWKYIESIHKQFGTVPLRSFPHYTLRDLVFFKTVHRRREIHILDFIPYVRSEVMQTLEQDVGWSNYGGKHHESVYTRFFQAYILPVKFGFDKRRAHLSALVCSEQVTRDEALDQLKSPPAPPELLRQDRDFVIKKLGVTPQEFDEIMAMPPKSFWDYPSYERGIPFRVLRAAYSMPRRIRSRRSMRESG